MAKTSYSQSDCYRSCSQHWHFKYVNKIKTEDVGSSTFFGSAVDSAIIDMLQHKDKNPYETFAKLWNAGRDFKGKPTQVFDNDNINFAHADFDADVINNFASLAIPIIIKWMDELDLSITYRDDWKSAFAAIAKAKKNPYKRFPEKYLKFFNRMSWLSLYYKGLLMIESFEKQFLPKIEQVLAVQKHSSIKDEETGDSISGYIDMILKIRGYDRPIIFDLKTSARPYTQEQIDHSEQLTIYLAMEGQRFNTDHVGYLVLSKAINKETVAYCKSCGHKRDGRHKTCNNEVTHTKELSVEDVVAGIVAKVTTGRCGGEWNETVELKPEVQILIEKKTDKQINDVLEGQSNIMLGMKNGVVFRNLSKCSNWFGGDCPFKKLCHKENTTGLIKEVD